MPNWANNVGDFIPNSISPPQLPATHTLGPSMLCYFCCYVGIQFDEFFKPNFFNYQINAAEYFSKYALRKLKMLKLEKTQNDTLEDQQWLRRRSEEW